MLSSLKGIHRTMWAITAISIINTLFVSMAGPFWVIYATKVIKLTVLEWGLIMLCMTGLRIIVSLPAGRIVDKVGKRKSILASLALMPIPVISFIYSKTFIQVLLSILFIEFLDDFLMPSAQALVADLIPREKRGLISSALGRGRFLVTVGGHVGGGTLAMFLPSMIGNLLGGRIYSINPAYPWLILAPALVVCMVIAAVFIHEPEKPEE
jgi:MFS family permease